MQAKVFAEDMKFNRGKVLYGVLQFEGVYDSNECAQLKLDIKLIGGLSCGEVDSVSIFSNKEHFCDTSWSSKFKGLEARLDSWRVIAHTILTNTPDLKVRLKTAGDNLTVWFEEKIGWFSTSSKCHHVLLSLAK
jgi:hypothetical protein